MQVIGREHSTTIVEELPELDHPYDQMLAGVFMIGLHKIGLMVTCKLEKKC